jgi:hypothetical protein
MSPTVGEHTGAKLILESSGVGMSIYRSRTASPKIDLKWPVEQEVPAHEPGDAQPPSSFAGITCFEPAHIRTPSAGSSARRRHLT